MVIDFHTHTYPDVIADKIVKQLSGPSNVKAYIEPTVNGLEQSCKKNSIKKAVILPVVTNPHQTESINRIAVETNMRNTSVISFGGIHPDNSDYKRIFSSLSSEGILGIKLHPIFQRTYFDDIKYMKLIECACEYGFIISVHAGLDINDPTLMYSSIPHIRNLLNTINPDKLILAHMGGHLCWDAAEEMLGEYLAKRSSKTSIYLDTAFSLPSPIASQNIDYEFLSNDQFVRIVRLIGADHVLFGTDSPWTDHSPSIEAIKNSGLTEKEVSLILYENGKNLLKY